MLSRLRSSASMRSTTAPKIAHPHGAPCLSIAIPDDVSKGELSVFPIARWSNGRDSRYALASLATAMAVVTGRSRQCFRQWHLSRGRHHAIIRICEFRTRRAYLRKRRERPPFVAPSTRDVGDERVEDVFAGGSTGRHPCARRLCRRLRVGPADSHPAGPAVFGPRGSESD